MEEMSMQIAQLQALTADLKAGLAGAVQDLSSLSQSSCALEDRMRNYQRDIEEKILGVRNSLNTFKEDLSAALSQIEEVNCRHVVMQQGVEVFQAEAGRHLLACQQRKNSKDSLDRPRHFPGETVPRATQDYPNVAPQHTTSSEQEVDCLQQDWTRCPGWAESQDPTDPQGTEESKRGRIPLKLNAIGRRYAAALELLESERLHVSHLSLLLKANITFNGSEAVHPKGKRPFPSCLRFLIQQHLELLHTLQERVLRFQWQGIVGDVFLRLFSKESDFLDFYVAYLKELPDCLAAVRMYSCSSPAEGAGLFEGDVTGKDNWLPLRNLLLQPVQRIPEYLTLLQSLLKLTEADHPDYFLLLVCIQQLRAFTAQYSPLLQQSQELLQPSTAQYSPLLQASTAQYSPLLQESQEPLQPGCREGRRQQQSQVRRRAPEQRQGREPQDWAGEGAPLSPGPCFGGTANPWLRSFPEAAPTPGPGPGSPPPGDRAGLGVLYEDGDSLANVSLSLFENGSSASSDSSLDVAFVRGAYAAGGGHAGRPPARGCVSPDDLDPARHRPLQAVQRKSRSLNGLQLDSSICADVAFAEFPGTPRTRGPLTGPHGRLERQPSRGSAGGKPQRSVSPLQRPELQDLQWDGHQGAPAPLSPQTTAAKPQTTAAKPQHSPTAPLYRPLLVSLQDCGPQAWGEDARRTRGSEENPRSFSERSRKEDQKGGIRSSFRKLFKKKSSGEKGREKSSESEAYSDHESGRPPQAARPGGADRGTAV
ncbi:rho guanine nucleotide exchange factor 33 [Conger conger]|uniref:rho guanine nucleotide exchange factor 33 n=1 Tax=Conger conger TaxID=82655 RepID=UPI002A59D35E|nr:rho guanine nucleotide exchange factor 33 [Conger conger]